MDSRKRLLASCRSGDLPGKALSIQRGEVGCVAYGVVVFETCNVACTNDSICTHMCVSRQHGPCKASMLAWVAIFNL